DFLIRARFLLHRLTGRKTDRMHLEYQELLAAEMGYSAAGGESPVEAFLKDFHTRALTVRSVSDGLLMQLTQPRGWGYLRSRRMIDNHFIVSSGLLSFSRPDDLKEDPLLMLKAFSHLAEKGLGLAIAARSQIRDLARKSASLHENREACGMFLRIFRSPGAEKALIGMLETGVIERLIPEFTSIKGKTIFDVYHTHTVDLHSIHTVSELKRLEKSEPDVFDRVADREALYLSSFLHDIGKGFGRPHAAVGVEIIRPIAGRFGFDKARTELAVFLVRNHLLLADIATRRDLSEEKVILDLAQKMGSIEKLSMLYLLTVADTKATGPNAWNEWKASLFRELYTRTLNILEKGILKDRRNANCLEMKWSELIRQEQAEEGSLLSGRLWALPQAYVLSSDISDIKRHVSLSLCLSGMDDVRIETAHRKNHTLLTIIARDRPGLFALITGMLAINRIEIISANIFTWYDGTAVDTFKVLPPWKDYKDWHAIERQLREFLSGKSDMGSRLMKTRALKTSEPEPVPSPAKDAISIDNDSSDFFTIIDIRAQERIGLVHDISKKISAFGHDIHRAFLSKSSDLFSLVYYIVDSSGEKIMNESSQRELLEGIEEVIKIPRLNTSP
ncbi:MAG TPA: HD domain-containing protein, partial [Deltaproteobacteria bacterium]|nr:HD domain-containing protein [Deltaproteobacteria bacterium]